MVRIIVDDILIQCSKPGRKSLSLIASKIVSEYPESFQDILGDKIGSGYDSLLAQLETRVANINRAKPQKGTHGSDSEEDSIEPPKKVRVQACSYGTKDWQPNLPPSEDTNSQKEKKELLQDLYSREIWDTAQHGSRMSISIPRNWNVATL